jgi:endonuclease/exonuclease/phosphatase family metal-dependent hydrolase
LIPINNGVVAIVLILFVGTLIGTKTSAKIKNEESSTVIAATYNIHYGYDSAWNYSLADQANTIEKSGADIIFLQEVDAGRITSLNVDNAFWLADRLGMQAFFAPALEGLSGVAILTSLPVVASDWRMLPSDLEQTAIVHTSLLWNGSHVDAYGVWLGLEQQERLNQIDTVLDTIGDSNLVIMGGDMNCEPLSAEYLAIDQAGFTDPFVETGNTGALSNPSINPDSRIDYVWTRGLESTQSSVSDSLASDHRLVAVSLSTD